MGNISFGTKAAMFCFAEDSGILTGIHTPFGQFAANSCLWKICAKDRIYTIADMEAFSYAYSPKLLNLNWSGQGIRVTVRLVLVSETVRWKIFVDMTDQTPAEQVLFPVLEGLTFGQEEYLLLPYQNGTLIKNPVENLFKKNVEIPFWLGRGQGAYINEYPAGFSYQFFAYYSAQNNGLYFATEDAEAYIKTFACRANEGGKGWDFEVTHYPENIGTATSYAMPYDFVLETFQGNWVTAGQRYRRWAIRQKWCGDKLSERQLPVGVTDVDLWRINHMNYALGTRTQEYFDTSVQLAKQLDCTLGLHWYGWNMGGHDVDYPEYISDEKKAEGWPAKLADWNRRFTEAGIFKIPYLNFRLWEQNTKSWSAEGAYDAAVKERDGKPKVEPWHNYGLTPMCPASVLWQKTCQGMCEEYVLDPGFDGVYMDQVASFNAKLCFDPTHNHPIGGGNWWNTSYHSLLHNARSVLGHDKVITTESCCETYVDVFDLFLLLDTNFQRIGFNTAMGGLYSQSVPLFNMIYGSHALSYGSICRFSDDPANFAYNLIRNTLWGFIPTVEGGAQEELDSPASAEHLRTLKQVVAFYQANKSMFLYGRLLDVAQCGPETHTLEWEIDEVGLKTEYIPAVEAALWETNDSKQLVVAYNFSDSDTVVSVFGKTVTVKAGSFHIG